MSTVIIAETTEEQKKITKLSAGMIVNYDDGRVQFIGIIGKLVSSTRAQIRPIDGYFNGRFCGSSWTYADKKYMKVRRE
jgi:hypothetical protein